VSNAQPRRIFRPAPADPLVRNAVVNFDPSRSRAPIATAYRMAARRLVDDVLAQGGDQDFLIGPISYLYRHSIELALKHIIATGYELLGRIQGLPHHHDLAALWREARVVILHVDPRAGHECERVDGEIAELADVDPASDAFRYPSRRDGQAAWPADLSLIDLQHLGESMDSLAERLEAAGDMLDMTLDAELEWRAGAVLAQDRP
jgi:hypothetical protein